MHSPSFDLLTRTKEVRLGLFLTSRVRPPVGRSKAARRGRGIERSARADQRGMSNRQHEDVHARRATTRVSEARPIRARSRCHPAGASPAFTLMTTERKIGSNPQFKVMRPMKPAPIAPTQSSKVPHSLL
jgi:hypothetical protein